VVVIDGPTVRVRLDVAYLGTGFHGFAVQPGVHTVGGVLVAALERNLRHTVEITCAGRTDAGVHAWGQVVSFDARSDVDPLALQRSVNKALRPSVVIREAEVVDNGPGVAPEIQDRIWEPFFTTKDVGQGAGLGLDIARRIVSRHSGSIELHQMPGETAFAVRLPATPPTR